MVKYLRSKATIVSILAGFCGIILILWAWQLPPFISSLKTTPNAYIQADIHYIHSQISGEIEQILASDYRNIQQGEKLFILKDSGQQDAYNKAQAEFNLKEIALKQAQTQILTKQDFDKAAIEQQLIIEKANLDIAKKNLDALTITSPISGRLGEIKVKIGQYINQATDLTSIITDKIWVVANYKETEIAALKIGQPAIIYVDALHGQKFTAHIRAIGSATTAEFSSQKPDMSNQNYIKVTKRVSVYLDFDQGQKNLEKLLSGLSVKTSIETQ